MILITGSTDGIGRLTAMRLAAQGIKLLVHGRNNDKVIRTVNELKAIPGSAPVAGFTADFASLGEVRKLARELQDQYDSLDVLINNAGAGFADPRYSTDGYELRFQVNYLAPFLLTRLLLPMLKNAAPSRIVNISSAGQRPLNFENVMFDHHFDPKAAYGQSKLAMIMFTLDLAESLKHIPITVNSLHPGTYLDTNMVRRSGIAPWGKPEDGAAAEVFMATDPTLDGVTGKYFEGKNEAVAQKQAYDAQARKQLHDLSLKLTGMSEPTDQEGN